MTSHMFQQPPTRAETHEYRAKPRVLSLSVYGSDIASGSMYSGALTRQKIYAGACDRYTVVVPHTEGAKEYHERSLHIIPIGNAITICFCVALFFYLRTHMKTTRYDVLMVDNPHVMGIVGLAFSTYYKVPLVVHSMADMPWNPWYRRERWANCIKEYISRFVVRHADVVRVSTHTEVDRLGAHGVPRERIVRIPFGVTNDAIVRAFVTSSSEDHSSGRHHTPDLDAREQDHTPQTILTIARLEPQKDLVTLLRAVSLVNAQREIPCTLRIVGDGRQKQRLMRKARSLGIHNHVVFVGKVPYSTIVDELRDAHIFALSSLYEGTCMVLHEAAYARLPLISTAHAGALERILDGEDGRIIPIRDHVALAKTLSQVLDDAPYRRALGQCAFKRQCAWPEGEVERAWGELLKIFSKTTQRPQ
jgi:glycosyltransferase involved in cell wall biosynthesis